MANSSLALHQPEHFTCHNGDVSSRGEDFWAEWFRQPLYDVAESIIRLRRLRGLTQAELADLAGTKQPAIARLETGRFNVSLARLTGIAEALGASVTVRLEPMESVLSRPRDPAWWEPRLFEFFTPLRDQSLEVHGTFSIEITASTDVNSAEACAMLWDDVVERSLSADFSHLFSNTDPQAPAPSRLPADVHGE